MGIPLLWRILKIRRFVRSETGYFDRVYELLNSCETTQTRPSRRCVRDTTISLGETWFVTQRQANDRSHHQRTTITYSLTTSNLSPHRTTFINRRSAHRFKSYLPEPPRPAIDFFIFGLAKFEFMGRTAEKLSFARSWPSNIQSTRHFLSPFSPN